MPQKTDKIKSTFGGSIWLGWVRPRVALAIEWAIRLTLLEHEGWTEIEKPQIEELLDLNLSKTDEENEQEVGSGGTSVRELPAKEEQQDDDDDRIEALMAAIVEVRDQSIYTDINY